MSLEARNQLSCMANATRATLAGGGFPGFNTIDSVTIASTGSAQDFGDTQVNLSSVAACGSPTRAIWGTNISVPSVASASSLVMK